MDQKNPPQKKQTDIALYEDFEFWKFSVYQKNLTLHLVILTFFLSLFWVYI